MKDIAEEFFLAEINPSNSDHTYSLVVQTEPEVEIETDDVTTEHSGNQHCGKIWVKFPNIKTLFFNFDVQFFNN